MLAIGSPTSSIRKSSTCNALLSELEVFFFIFTSFLCLSCLSISFLFGTKAWEGWILLAPVLLWLNFFLSCYFYSLNLHFNDVLGSCFMPFDSFFSLLLKRRSLLLFYCIIMSPVVQLWFRSLFWAFSVPLLSRSKIIVENDSFFGERYVIWMSLCSFSFGWIVSPSFFLEDLLNWSRWIPWSFWWVLCPSATSNWWQSLGVQRGYPKVIL